MANTACVPYVLPSTVRPHGAHVIALAVLAIPLPALSQPELRSFRNSPGISEAIGVNQAGVVLGRREIPRTSVLSHEFYVRTAGIDRPIPLPNGFTNIELHRIANSGHVVGFGLRAPGNPNGSQRALRWRVGEPTPELLPVPDGFRGSCAFDIDQSGVCIAGFVLGRDPARLQPCIWYLDGDRWSYQLLTTFFDYNPMLTSARVAVSDDAKWVAASLVTAVNRANQRRYGLFVWRRREDGTWQRQAKRVDRAVHLGDVNNHGLVVGRVLNQGRRRAFISDPDRGSRMLPLPAGRESSYATAVNNKGLVVGVMEDPPGPKGSMSGFTWNGAELKTLPLPGNVVMSTANHISDDQRIAGLLVREPADNDNDNEAPETAFESFVLKLP